MNDEINNQNIVAHEKMSKKLKYISINIGVIVFVILGMLLEDFSIGSSNQVINGLQTLIADITMIFPFIFYAIITTIDINTNKEITKFGRYSRNTYFSIASMVIIIGVGKAIIWFVNGTTGSSSGTWISWTYDYRGVLMLTICISVFIFIIGLAINLYIWLISNILLKIKRAK